MISAVIPLSLIYFGTRYLLAISSFSCKEYPEVSTISILSRRAGWMVSRVLAVAMKKTFERSNGVLRK